MKFVNVQIEELIAGHDVIELLLPVSILIYLYHITNELIFLQGAVVWFFPSSLALTGAVYRWSDYKRVISGIASLITQIAGGGTAVIASWNNIAPSRYRIPINIYQPFSDHLTGIYGVLIEPRINTPVVTEFIDIYPQILGTYIKTNDIILLILFFLLLWSFLRIFATTTTYILASILSLLVRMISLLTPR